MADIEVSVNYSDLQLLKRELLGVAKEAKTSASVFEREYKKVERELAKTAKSSQTFYNSILGLEQPFKKASDSASVFEKALKRTELEQKKVQAAAAANTQELKRLRMSTDAVYAAEQKLLNLKKLLRTEVAAGNMTMREAAAVQMQYKSAIQAQTVAQQAVTKGMNRMGVVTQQAGYQVGDFLVQIQGGTNPLVAFGQQATQLVGVLPLIAGSLGMTTMAAIGLSSALGIGIPLVTAIGAAFMRTSEGAEEAKDSIEELKKTHKENVYGVSGEELAYIDKVANARLKAAEAEAELRQRLATTARNSPEAAAQQRKAVAEANAEVEESLRLWTEFKNLRQGILELEANAKEDSERADAVKEIVEARNEEIRALAQQNVLLGIAKNYGENSAEYAAKKVELDRESYRQEQLSNGIMGNNLKLVMAFYDTQQALTSEVEKTSAESKLIADGMSKAAVEALKLAGVDIASGVSDAVKEAAKLADLFQVSLERATAIRSGASYVQSGGMDAAARGAMREHTPNIFGTVSSGAAGPNRATTKSSRGSSVNEPEKALEAYRQLVATYDEVEAKLLKIEAAEKTLNTAKALGVITTLQADEALKEYTKSLEDTKSPMLDLANTASQAMSEAFMSIVDGSKSASDAFADMARAIIKQAFEMAVINPIINSLFGGVSGFTKLPSFFADGGVFSGGSQVKAFATGGVVGSPTFFPMSGGKTGLMGEAGPEAIMPLKRGSNGKLGVQMEGGGGSVVVNQSFNFQANGDESVKKLIAQAAPKIAQMTKSSLIDDRRRGGQVKNAFG